MTSQYLKSLGGDVNSSSHYTSQKLVFQGKMLMLIKNLKDFSSKVRKIAL